MAEANTEGAALSASGEAWESALDAIPHLAWMADGSGRFGWFNRRWYDYTGTTAEQVGDRGWHGAQHPEHHERVRAYLNHAWVREEPWELSFPLRAADGSFRWFLTRAEPVRDEAGRVVRWLGTHTDITEQRAAEADRERLLQDLAAANAALEQRAGLHAAELERVAGLHELVLGAVGDGVFGMDLDGVTTFVNPVASELTGWTREEMIGRIQHETVHHHHPDGRPFPKEECPLFQSLRTGTPLRGEDAVFYRKDGSTFPVAYASRPIHAAGGELVGAVVTFRDITQPLRAREEIQRRQAELEARNAEQETFLYTVSHDLRAPLISMEGIGDLLASSLKAGDTSGGEFLLERILRNARHMGRLLDGLLALSRAGRQVEEATTLDLGEVTREVLTELEDRIAMAGVEVVTPEEWPAVRYPRFELYQVLANLVGNSLKWAGRDGNPLGDYLKRPVLHLSTTEDSGTVSLRVEENGPGIPPEYREKVFGLFQKVNPRSEGSGIGLAIVKRIVERHGGRIWVEDSHLGGAAFVVTLPGG